MGSKRFLGVLFVILMGFLSTSQAYNFFVGGKDGWVLHPSEKYNHWAERNRFRVNDTLSFKYKKGSDSVLVVTKEHYYACNTTSPMQTLADGHSIFTFGRSGPFFFISGSGKNCQKGQKLIVVVLAVRNKTRHSSLPSTSPVPEPSASPSPAADTPASPESPKGESPGSGSPKPSESPSDFESPLPSPSAKSGAPGRAAGSVGLALGISIGVSVVLSSFVGMV
ncbi:early nodulin-like protein 3 [Alnus glutinosa]|uniref:early nodulin-like protein 3 n=1 Tax=Alnus glutinosa TaxID=3517 RepID=UPI002D799CEB|nr:early nodulin-like protein 3 [Alnus glutinosa]